MRKHRLIRAMILAACFTATQLVGVHGSHDAVLAQDLPNPVPPEDLDVYQLGYKEMVDPAPSLPGEEEAEVGMSESGVPARMRQGSADAHSQFGRRHGQLDGMRGYAAGLARRAANIRAQRTAGTELQP